MSDDDKIVHAFPSAELPENLMTVAPRPPGAPYYCKHDAVRLDAFDRTVQCARCGVMLDPFDFLLDNAMTMTNAWRNHSVVKSQLSDLNDRMAYLKKEEKRLLAKVRRLAAKTNDVILDRSAPV